MEKLDVNVLRELLRYEPDTGKLYWKPRPREMFNKERDMRMWNTRYSNAEAFTSSDRGYKVGSIFGVMYKAHRVAYAISHGRWPEDEVDHINHIRCDNRIANLREVLTSENSRNRKLKKNNATGVTGVFWNKSIGRWAAVIRFEYKQHYLGVYKDFEDAVAARKKAERYFGFHANHGKD